MPLFKEVHTVSTASIKSIQQPVDRESLSMHSRATDVFTDFARHSPLVIERSTGIQDALQMMARTHVKLKLVIDAQESFRGVLTLDDLMSARVLRAMEASGLRRNELTVGHVMTPRSALRAIDISDFAVAKIGDLVATMKKYGEHHILVVDMQSLCVRGIVSANEIARRMNTPVVISERANSFTDIFHAVAH